MYELLPAWFGRRGEVVTVSTEYIPGIKNIPTSRKHIMLLLFGLVMIIVLCSGRTFERKDSQINYYNSIVPVAVVIVIVFCIFSRCFVRLLSVYSCAWYSLPVVFGCAVVPVVYLFTVVWLCGYLV